MIFCQILVFLIELQILFFLRAWSLPPSHVGAIVETIAGLAAGQHVRNHFRVHGPHCNKRLTIFPSSTWDVTNRTLWRHFPPTSTVSKCTPKLNAIAWKGGRFSDEPIHPIPGQLSEKLLPYQLPTRNVHLLSLSHGKAYLFTVYMVFCVRLIYILQSLKSEV